MTIDKNFENGKLYVAVTGKLNTVSSPELEAELQNLEEVNELVIDFKNLEHISSAGLRVLLNAQQNMDNHGTMVVKNVNKDINEIFVLTGFSTFLTIE